jgi:hypothetical protein
LRFSSGSNLGGTRPHVSETRPAILFAAQGVVLFYLAAIIATEVIIAFVSIHFGLAGEALILFALINQYTFASQPDERVRHTFVVLALIPLARLASLTLPQATLSMVYWEALILLPILLGIAFTSELVDPKWLKLAGGRRPLWIQGLVAVTGIPAGLGLAQSGLEGEIDGGSSGRSIVPAVVVLFTSGVTVEIMFRGLVQSALSGVFGRLGIGLTTAVFASLFLGTGSTAHVALAAALGVGYGMIVAQTGSVVGVSIAHGVLNVGWIVVWPRLL